MSALADKLGGYAAKGEILSLTEQLEELREEVYAPGAYIYYGTNHFLTDDGSDPLHADYDAKVEEGIRFPSAGSETSELALLNPNDVFVSSENGFILPKYGHAIRMDLTGYSSETRLAQYTYENIQTRELTRSRTRRRYGESMKQCSNGRWWRQGVYDLAKNVFRIDGETWEVTNGVPDRMPNGDRVPNGNVHWLRVRRFWIDTFEEQYWDKVTTTQTVSGQQVAQTFLNSQDGWLSQVGLYFSRKATEGDVNILLTETVYGMPDLSRVISRTTLAAEDIKVGALSTEAGLPSLVESKVPIIPTYLMAGRRYALVVVTAGDHYVAMTDTDNGVVQGTFFVSTDGAYYSGNLTDDLKMRLYFARFERTRVSVELQALQLAGGILDLDVINPGVNPPACRTDIELQINGAWVALDGETAGPDLTGLPALVPVRVTFTGTTDLMPGFGLTGSQATVSRPKTAFTWMSEARSLGSPTESVKVVTDLQYFEEDNHDCAVSLLTGATYNVVETPDVIEDAILPDGTTRRTSIFNLPPVDDYALKITGSTVNAANSFLVGELIEYAQS
jgi:hypothetical protein